MDIHNLSDITQDRLNELHHLDCAVQKEHGVRYVKWWWNEQTGKVFCLVEAPSAEAAHAVHEKAHGFVADEILEVEPSIAEHLMGPGAVSEHGGALVEPDGHIDSGFRTILFTDIEGSTDLTQRLGDAAAMDMLRAHDAIVREALKAHGGREVKHTGDGIMAAFSAASPGVGCAIAVQRALAARNQDAEEPIRVAAGLSAGEPVEDSSDLFGATVQLAARVCSHARGDQIIVANVVAELCVGKGFRFNDLGEVELKGFTSPVRVHEISWREAEA
jgi:class 3 adenylate cyclase